MIPPYQGNGAGHVEYNYKSLLSFHFISKLRLAAFFPLSRSFQPLAHWKAFGMMMKLPADAAAAAASAAVVRRRVRREGEQQWAAGDGERRDALLDAAERCMEV